MEPNAWWLLAIPLFFGFGWFAARIDAAQLLTETKALPNSYFKGLNYLLSEQPDLAILAFEEVARLDPDTAELYFALGQLFRRRGEPDRAIRIHKNLLQRADLPALQREQALFELAQDFLAAGIFDHAEQAFQELGNTRYSLHAQRELAKLYEKEGNWPAAIQSAQSYLDHATQETDLESVRKDLSHYRCELAAQFLQQNLATQAVEVIDQVQATEPGHARLPFLRAQSLFALKHYESALDILSQALQTQPALTYMATHIALTGLAGTLSNEQLTRLFQWVKGNPSASTVQLLAPHFLAAGRGDDYQALLQLLATQLEARPETGSMLAVTSLWSAIKQEQLNSSQQTILNAVEKTAGAIAYRYDRPQCSVCGFKATRHHWRCPGCGHWGTLPYTA